MFSAEPVVTLRNADIYQGERKVLENVNFEIDKGEFVFLIGRTGSGKSSLLKTLYADLWLESGSAVVAGYEIHNIRRKDIPYLRRRIGIVFQDFQLFFDRSVDENLRFVLRATGWKESNKMTTRIHEVLMQVGLTSAINKMPHQLSGGEQQRVVIARALLNEPAIIFADEPTGNLDPEVSEQILKTFLTINKAGTAILMATHDYDLLRLHTARTLKCEDSKVIEK
ncbi:MAG: ATP-binding cassette domain-containing protein [Spirosomataceae bacterium]